VPEVTGPPAVPGEHTESALRDWGFSGDEVAKFRDAGALR
jgi:alpha-methylacyl-CoA racemase